MNDPREGCIITGVTRVRNGWTVSFGGFGSMADRTYVYENWPDVLRAMSDTAFLHPVGEAYCLTCLGFRTKTHACYPAHVSSEPAANG